MYMFIVPAQTPELFLADNITIIEGSNVTMWCVGDVGYPPAQIRWTKTIDSMVTEMNSSSTSSTPSSCDVTGYANDTLTFTATRDDHNAIYKCEFIDGLSSGNYDEISLNVACKLYNNKRQFKVYMDRISIRIHLNLLLNKNFILSDKVLETSETGALFLDQTHLEFIKIIFLTSLRIWEVLLWDFFGTIV